MAGETTALPAGSYKTANVVPTKGDHGSLHVHTVVANYTAATQLETNDVMEVAHLPEGMTIYQVIVTSTDLDTGTGTIVQKLTVQSTDIVTGVTTGAAGTTALFNLAAPYTTGAYDLLKIITTTAANAGATSGTVTLRLIYTAN